MERNFQSRNKEYRAGEKRPRSEGSRNASVNSEERQRSRNESATVGNVAPNQTAQGQGPMSIQHLLNPVESNEQCLQNSQRQVRHLPSISQIYSHRTEPESMNARKRSRVLENGTHLHPETLPQLSGIPSASGAGASSGADWRRGTEGESAEVNLQNRGTGASHGAADSRRYGCDICGLQCARKAALISHKAIHNPNRPRYPCGKCDKSFLEKRSLDRHMDIHDPACKFACTWCGKKFSRKSNLEQHISTHDPQNRPIFTCEGCSKTFTQKSHLKRHEKNRCPRQ